MKFATLLDVARSAGVSYATADRVVNARGGVAEKSKVRVHDAIAALGYRRDESAANLARKRIYRFHFLLPDDSNEFFCALNDAVQAHSRQPRVSRTAFQVTRMPAFCETALVRALDGIDAGQTECLCVVALDTPAAVDAVRRARARGVPVVTLVSDIAADARDHYVGIDNLVAGRTAGRMMGLAHFRRPGCVLPIIGAARAHDHTERLRGFRALLRMQFPQVEILDPVVSGDDAATIHRALSQASRAHPGLSGVYNVGAGNEGLTGWVSGIASPSRPAIVLHELLPGSRRALEAGWIDAVIDQKPYETIGEALRIMHLVADGQPPPHAVPGIAPAIYLCENLPPAGPSSDRNPPR